MAWLLIAEAPVETLLNIGSGVGAVWRWCVSIVWRIWDGRRWWAADAPGQGTAVRRTLYTAWCGALGATLGWAVWIVGDVVLAHPRDLAVSAVVGGVLGVLLAGLERYHHARRLDAAGREAGVAPAPPIAVPVRILMTTVALVFLRTALEDTSTDLVKAVYRPLFVSILIYLPAAATLGMAMEPADLDNDSTAAFWWQLSRIHGLIGLPLGAAIGAVVFLLDGALDEGVGFGALVGWWMMISMSAAMMAFFRTESKRGILLGLGALLIAVFLAVWGASAATEVDADNQIPKVAWLPWTATIFGKAMVSAPDVPSRTWSEAEGRLRADGVEAGHDPNVPASVTGWLSRTIGCAHIPTTPSEKAPQSYLTRKRAFCADLQDGWNSGLARSWVVLAGFLLGIGSAARIDERFIPEDYGESHTRRYDRYAAVATIVLVLTGAIVLRFT